VLVALPDDWWTSDRLVLTLWCVWGAVAGRNTLVGLIRLARARRSCRPFPAAIEARLPQWLSRRARRTARLVTSDTVRSAAVLAGPTPIIAVNPALVQMLDPADLDRVVMHEWAHIERRDDLALFPQLAGYLVAGWHPAAWWLNRHIDFEREVACDERVIRLSGSPRAYAQCLAALARVAPAGPSALPAVSAGPGSHLRQRVARILHVPHTPGGPMRALIVVATVLPVAVAAGVADLRVIGAMPAALMARVAIAASFDETLGAPTPAAGVLTAAQPARKTARRVPQPAEDSRRRAAGSAGEARSGDAARVGMADVEERSSARSEVPLMPAIASAVHWSYTTLPDGAATAPTPAVVEDATPPPDAPTLWGAAATGGVAVGRGSQKAAVSTAGFLARVGKSIAGSF
jgi:hypothetical protein